MEKKKRLFLFTFILCMLLPFFDSAAYPYSWDYTLPVVYKPIKDVDPEPNPEIGIGGQRKPQRPLIAIISSNSGVTVSGVEKGEIYSYEIYSSSGDILVAVYTEEDFLDSLYSLTEQEVEIRFILSDGYYSGFLNL